MAKKIDLSGVKEYMFNHGEKVALGTCAFIAVLFGALGLWRALGANKADGTSSTLTEELTNQFRRISERLGSAQAPELPDDTKKRMDPSNTVWAHVDLKHQQNPLIQMGPEQQEKRGNPSIYSIKKEPKYFDMQYLTTLVHTHKFDPTGVKVFAGEQGGGGGGGGLQGGGDGGVKPPGGLGGGGGPKMGGGGARTGTPFVHAGRPLRAVVGTAVFPMKQQVLEYQRALQMLTQRELFQNRDDLPKAFGIDVIRYEVKSDGQFANPNGEVLVGVDPKTGKFVKSPGLEALLKEAVYDETMPAVLEPYLWEGFHLPLPRLAHGRYPRFQIEGVFDIAWGDDDTDPKGDDVASGKQKGPADPKGGVTLPGTGKGKGVKGGDEEPGPAGPDRKVDTIKVKDLQKDHAALHQRLYQKNYNIYHVLGQFRPDNATADKGRYFAAWDVGGVAGGEAEGPDKKGGQGKPPGVPGGVGGGGPNIGLGGNDGQKQPQNPGGGLGGKQNAVNWERDAVVRFIDPDVEPGRTYKYAIRVRMVNPNHNKPSAVAFAKLAEMDVLMSDWEFTPSINVPYDYFLYVLDQQLHDEWTAPPVIGAKPVTTPPDPRWRDHAFFQIHQWIQKKFDPKDRTDFVIGDWAVAERVVVRRGERIGIDVPVVVPVWKERKDAFEIPVIEKDAKDKKSKTKLGFKIDMRKEVTDNEGKRVEEDPPVLVDYVGGKRGVAKVEEEAAQEALILSADGTLHVLNSRVDTDPAFDAAKARQERLSSVRRRATALSAPARGSGDGKDPKMPGTGLGK